MRQQCQFVQIPVEILEDPRITPIEFRLYCILMRFGFEGTGFSQAGHDLLSKKVGCHKQTIAKSLKRLQIFGLIEIQRVGLNRNDKIFCLKTIKGKKKPKPLSASKSVVKKSESDRSPSYSNNRTKDYRRPATETDSILRRSETISTQDKKVDKERTIAVHNRLQEQMRIDSYNIWLKDAEVITDNENSMEIRLNSGIIGYDFVRDNYLSDLESILGKSIELRIE